MRLAFFGLAAAFLIACLPASAQQTDVYRTLTVQAAPGQLLELIELVREERALFQAIGETPPYWMRHSQGDFWDLMLLYPIGGMQEYFDPGRLQVLLDAQTPSGKTGAQLQAEILALTAWRDEVFVSGPPLIEVQSSFDNAGYFHVEIFEGLAGKRAELIREREMENDYLVRLGRAPNHIFTRIAGSSTDAFTIGYYQDLQDYANQPGQDPAAQDAAAKAAGFEGSHTIGSYLRALILRHHDTLATAIPDAG